MVNQMYQKRCIPPEEDNKLLMNEGQYNNIVMEYQKIANLLDNASNQPSKFRTKNWVEINDESRGTYSVNRQINFKISMLRSNLQDYSDAYIIVKGNTSVNNTAGENANRKKSFMDIRLFTLR